MRQESGYGKVAEARGSAPGRVSVSGRPRRACGRIVVAVTAVAAATTVGLLTFPAGGVGAQPVVKTMIVNTTRDLVPTPSASDASLLAACLKDAGPLSAGGDEGLLANTEKNVNITIDANDQNPNGSAAQLRNVKPCSLRMALHLAAVLSPSQAARGQQDVTADSVVIKIGSPELTNLDAPKKGGNPLTITPDEALSNGSLASVPLPPIRGGSVTIDGCGMEPTSKTPCVNLEFGGVSVTSALNGVPGGTPGLIAMADETTIKGIAFQGGRGPAILTPPVPETASSTAPGKLIVQNSYFGLKTDGTPADAAPPVGIQLSANDALIGGTNPGEGNVFAGENATDVGVLIAGGSDSTIVGNRFGTDASGKALSAIKLANGVRVTGLGANGSRIAHSVNQASAVAGQAPIPEDQTFQSVAQGNKIGDKLDPAAAASAACDGACNVFAGAQDFAIDVGGEPLSTDTKSASNKAPVGVVDTVIAANWIGIDAAGNAGKNKKAGIVVRNGSRRISDGSRGTQIGGSTQAEYGNVISRNGGPGVLVAGGTDPALEQGAGLGTVFERNTGQANTGGPLIDLGGDGVGNAATGPSGGVQAPTISTATTTEVSGSAQPGATVDVYLVPSAAHKSGHGDIEAFLAETRASATSGRWSVAVSIPAGRSVTATANAGLGTSELATNAAVQVPSGPSGEGPKGGGPAPFVDGTAPLLTRVLGKDPSKGRIVVPRDKLKAFSGRAADESGVEAVRIGLQVVRTGKSRRAGKKPSGCRFVDLKRAKLVERPCNRPLFTRAQLRTTDSGETIWRVPLSNKTRNRIHPGRYRLHTQLTDTAGNTSTQRVPLVITR